MKIELTMFGTVRGKQRHVVTKTGHRYTPQQTVNYEDTLALLYKGKYHGFRFDKDVPLRLSVVAHYEVPKSDSKTKTVQKLNGMLRPIKKPDYDNVLKIITDALNKIAYYDDAQIVECDFTKVYDRSPRVEIKLEEVVLTNTED